MNIGDRTERLTLQSTVPQPVSVSSITRSDTTATATTAAPHGFESGDFVTVAGADQAAYNGEVQVTVTGPTTFTFTVAGAPATPATGTITATFTSDAQGGSREGWWAFATVWAMVRPMSAGEVLAAQSIGMQAQYHVEIGYRPDVSPRMRAQWTPYRYSTAKTLEIHSVLPHEAYPKDLLVLQCGEVI